jgi:glycine hydroxymethyltransferase
MKLDLQTIDPEIFQIIQKEEIRQKNGLEMIASENYCSPAVMQAQGSVLTNKYAEGYPNKRYYDGCVYVDQSEQLAIDRLKKLFQAEYANVQPHSGSSANMGAYMALCQPGDTLLGMDLSQGGHLTHGASVNFSGKLYKFVHYGLNLKTERLDYDALAQLAKEHKPKMIVAGASSYARIIDFAKIAQIARDNNALFLVDMAHIAGLVATGNHPSPIELADVVTSTTHKTLRGPRGGIILAKKEHEKVLNSVIFPGIQGGPLEHVIAAKAVAFHEALQPSFKKYVDQVVLNARCLAEALIQQGLELVTNGTDNHLLLLKTFNLNLSGKEASILLDHIGITCNKNMVPGDTRSPMVTSGVRLGTPALTTRGMKEKEMKIIAEWIALALKNPQDANIHNRLKNQVLELCQQFPLFHQA